MRILQSSSGSLRDIYSTKAETQISRMLRRTSGFRMSGRVGRSSAAESPWPGISFWSTSLPVANHCWYCGTLYYTLLPFLLLSQGYSGKLRCTKLLPTTAGTVVHFEINSYWAVHQGVDSSCQPMLVWYSALHIVLGVQHFGTLRRIFWKLRGKLS